MNNEKTNSLPPWDMSKPAGTFNSESLFTPWQGETFGEPFKHAPDPINYRDAALSHPAIPNEDADAIAENMRLSAHDNAMQQQMERGESERMPLTEQGLKRMNAPEREAE